MRMPVICRCQTYGYAWYLHVSLFFHRDPKNIIVGNAVPEPSGWPDDIVDSRTGTGGLNGKLFRF
ncbi:hypothetical protein HMPREF1608_00200 [Escherichia coli 908525]|nr:hypothetical protein C381_p00175 [Escherichia coli EC302/04]AZU10073.1 hypothetical protein FORC79_p032 [Salmonella enterica subsp. enterica serovar Typhimurium]ESD28331.1 hypothetical protein HMPREF1597_00138 [Escherichia coli 907701]ESD39462.1 hypothetical protein HMPREF1604_03085 [Escherichia coli 908519]ESD80100.1 hypothetical protein HMPREF1608_00200 [Escherichia coli 908525]ESD97299.1 hypothetical protein HMPREF1612_00113 [Escherichia coli 908585]